MYRLWTTLFLLTMMALAACNTPQPQTPDTPTPAPTLEPAASQLPDHIPGTWASPSDATFALDIAADGTVTMHADDATIEMRLVSNDDGLFALDDGFSEPYFAIFQNNRMYVYRTPDTSQQPAFILARQAANGRILPPEGDPAPLPSDLIGTWGMPGAGDTWHMTVHQDGRATFGREPNVFTGTLTMNTNAALFFDDGSSAPVPVERKSNLLLFAAPNGDENTLGFVLQKMDDTGAPLPLQHESVVPLPLFDPAIVETVVITHAWSGRAEMSPITGIYTLRLTETGATGTATYTAGTGANAITQTVPITIPTTAMKPLLDAAAHAPLLDEPYRAVLLASDNYPFYGISIQTGQRHLRYSALTQLPLPLPWRVSLEDETRIYTTYTPAIGRALHALDPYLRRDVQQAMVPWYRPWLVEEQP